MALRFRIIAQYMVKTKFDDAMKILLVREKMANLVVGCQYVMCSFFETVYIPVKGDIYY